MNSYFWILPQKQMLNDRELGSTQSGTSFADIIINSVSSVADGTIQGFAQFVHDPVSLKTQVENLAKQRISTNFSDAVTQRKIAAESIDNLWNFPLNVPTSNTTPLPWTFVEANIKSQQASDNSWEFNIQRTVDFIGRNFLKFTLPAVDCSEITDSAVRSGQVPLLSHPEHVYLGAWHTDLVPRIISKVEFYTRSNSHKLFEYTGYDIYVHNILFGNAHKEMNDILAGEDKFELCYDPYRVDGSAMGLASFKGIDAYSSFTPVAGGVGAGVQKYQAESMKVGQQDGFVDYFQLDTTMDDEEFRKVYRNNVWYEAPVARNYWARHSIHSRRMFHQKKDIIVPLDILPFGYSIGSSLPTASIAVECGFIKVKVFEQWLDKSFYLTKVSDIPALHPLVNHTHLKQGDLTPEGQLLGAADPREGWVNERSIGRYGDPEFSSTDGAGDDDAVPFSTPGSLLGAAAGIDRENIVPTITKIDGASGSVIETREGKLPLKGSSRLARGNFGSKVSTSTSRGLNDLTRNVALTDKDSSSTAFLHKLSAVDNAAYNRLKGELKVKLLQVGYQTLPCIREYFSKLPNIYITTEWKDDDFNFQTQSEFSLSNDLYIQGIVLWAIPKDANDIESMRVYPCHMIDHEYPVIAGLKLNNDMSQGETIYDWSMLNTVGPAQMNLNPLIENMGLISFSPSLKANEMPFAFYDTNINSILKFTLLKGNDADYLVNLKNGTFKVICIGINGVACVNCNLFKLIF